MSVTARRIRYLGYVLLSTAAVGAYVLILLLAVLSVFPDPWRVVFAGLPVLMVILALEPLRQVAQVVLDRLLFREGWQQRQELLRLGNRLIEIAEPEAVVTVLTRVLADGADVSHIRLWYGGGEHLDVWQHARAGNGVAGGSLQRRSGDDLDRQLVQRLTSYRGMSAAQAARIAGDLWRRHVDRAPEDAQALYVVPLQADGGVMGLLLLGRRRFARTFVFVEKDLVEAIAQQAVVALKNAAAFERLRALENELAARVHERTQELGAKHRQQLAAYEELRVAQARVMQSEKLASLGQLIAGVAHELNTPVSFVAGSLTNLEVYVDRFLKVLRFYESAPLLDQAAEGQRHQLRGRIQLQRLIDATPSLLRICDEGAARIRAIVRNLSLFSSGEDEVAVDVELSQALAMALRFLDHRIQHDKVEVLRDFDESLLVRAPAGKLAQVWLNLLSNALDAMAGRADPRLQVSVRVDDRRAAGRPGAFAQVRIADNGSGIEPAIEAQLFTPFATTKPPGKGTGLGLSLVRATITGLGGSVELHNREDGCGAVALVRLPLHSAA